ncbi:MAG: pyrrolo-quinoline quinone, partial [Candidatus Cybelea sp.]
MPIQYPTDVLTYHYNVFRQGQTMQETTLTPSNVNFNTFGKINFFTVDGKVDAQPLFVNKQFISGSLNDTVYVVTENDSIYAFSANSGRQFWHSSALGQGETPSDDHGCSQIAPQIGITDTPVIDKGNGPNGAIYFVAMTKDSSGNYHQRLHALDLMTGAELFGGPTEISATYPGTGDGSQNGQVIFAPGQFAERAGILEYGTTLYISFTSHCDSRPYTGWLMAYNSRSLAQTSVIDVTPNGSKGAIWMTGEGLAADSSG